MTLAATIRNAVTHLRPFGLSNSDSLMNFSHLGSLHCQCEPTDASEPRNDRRCSCRACGNAILPVEPTKLYERLSKREIRQITRRLRNAGMDAAQMELVPHLTNLSRLHRVGSLAELCGKEN